MTGKEALLIGVIRGEYVRDVTWPEGASVGLSKKHPSRLVDQNEIEVSIQIFNDYHRTWEIYKGVKPKETCTFVELFDKLGPGDWATVDGSEGEYYLDTSGDLYFRRFGVSIMPAIFRCLVNATFTIHRAKQ